ncbi:MAG: hypothetical protein IJX10_01610 [Phascolarctobacterium sp.]|nr:hypothetical protein [Phascolarctobacterium sp.]
MLIKKFPAPSRIDYVPSPYEPNEDGVMDVGYYNGALSDGRAYRVECWRMDEMLMMTVMFSDLGLSAWKRQDMFCLLELEGILEYTAECRAVQCARTQDDAERGVWALNMMLANGKGTYGKLLVPLHSYK